jgi:HK97 gp10 family phage protein
MATVSVNTAQVNKSLESNITKAMEAAGRALGVVAIELETQAKKNADGPYVKSGPHVPWAGEGPNKRTGQLKLRIAASRPKRVGFGSYTADVTSGMRYSRYVEEGTSKTGKYPFMEPAFRKVEPVAQTIFSRAYNKFRS